MKKLLSILLVLCIAFSCFVISASAKSEPLNMLVASDIHYQAAPASLPHYNDDALFFYSSAMGNMYPESAAIFEEFLDQAKASQASCVLLPGDLVNSASVLSHAYITAKLSEFENATGKKVFVINGNHDISSTFSRAAFKAAYSEFGYNEALAVDSASCSYTAQLNSSYRLLAIDSCSENIDHGEVSAATIAWITEQINAAKADNQSIIAMMHYAITPHIPYQKYALSNYYITNYDELGKLFADNGVKTVFTGHFHINDIAVYESAAESSSGILSSALFAEPKNVYDVMTGTLTANSCAYREVNFTDSAISFVSHRIENIDTTAIKYLYSEEQLQLLNSDFSAYAEGFYKTGIEKLMLAYINTDKISGALGVSKDSAEYATLAEFVTAMHEFLTLPMYSNDGTESVQSIAAGHGITLPASDYADTAALLAEYVAAITAGNENFDENSLELSLCQKAITTMFHYAMKDVSVEELTALLPDDLNVIGSAVSSISKEDMITSISNLLFKHIILDLGVDDSPADNDFEMENEYQTEINPFLAFIKRIIEFFKKLFSSFKLLFVK